jgi:hypothetical protein
LSFFLSLICLFFLLLFKLKRRSTRNFMIHGELGASPMSVYIKLCMVNYWSKLVNGKVSKLSLILFKYMYIKNYHGQYQSSWFDNVKSILDNWGFSNIWESQENFNCTRLNIALKQILFDKNGDQIRKTRQKGYIINYLKTILNLNHI